MAGVQVSSTCDEDQEKHDDARSISKRNTVNLDWYMTSREVIVLRPVFTVVCSEI
jgi:hypothetical protein